MECTMANSTVLAEKNDSDIGMAAPVTGDVDVFEAHDPAIEQRLVKKLDVIILPLLAIIYFTHSLDRANLGNAKTDGIEDDLGLQTGQYSLVLTLFYIPYGTMNIPATILAKRFNPSVVIPVLMFGWGAISLAAANVRNLGGLIATRVCLGAVEAGFFPSAIYYLTMFYTRHEIAKRISVFYCMGFIANAFSGLIAFRVFQWNEHLLNWQYLFIIEGSLTCFLSIVSFVFLPRDVHSSRFFSPAEKHCSKLRLRQQSEFEPTKFSWATALKPLLDWHTWAFGFMALCYGVAAASISNFLPTIIKRLTRDTVQANLYTIAPNLNGAVWIMVACWLSDRLQSRAFCSIVPIALSMVGFICLGTVDLVDKAGLGYFFTFLLTCGGFTPAILVPAWTTSNITSDSARATTLGLLSGLQNIAGIISSYAFRSEDAPVCSYLEGLLGWYETLMFKQVYRPALVVSGCFQGGMILTATFMWVYYRQINLQIDRGQRQSAKGMEQNPDFRYVL